MQTKLWLGHRGTKQRGIKRFDTPIVLKQPPHNSPRDTAKRLIQVHKTHLDRLGEFPCTLEGPAEGVELVHCSTAGAETTLLLLNPRFDLQTNSLHQHPWLDHTREVEVCDPPGVGIHSPVIFPKNGDQHPSLPIQRNSFFSLQSKSVHAHVCTVVWVWFF